MKVPAGATHQNEDRFYKKAVRGAYFWDAERAQWCYMEDDKARRVLRKATPLAR